jgi:RHS repeat-associated protein
VASVACHGAAAGGGAIEETGRTAQPLTEPTAPSNPTLPGTPFVAGSTSVGFLPGNGSVDAAGQFNYDVPLDVPDGIAGMTPSLALHYSSGGGNGPLGRGWVVQGWTSAITRCDKTIASDGVTAGLAFDSTDSLCLDGAKLVLVANSSPPEYRTEQDSIARIVAPPLAAAFTVYLKNGRSRTYSGLFTQTRLDGNGNATTVIPAWLLTQEQDLAGNTINYVYDTQSSGSAQEILVDHIDYGTISGSSASRTIKFVYDTKVGTDANATAYHAGLENKLSQRLRQIQMLAPNPSTKQVVWSYQLGYQDQGLLGRTLLTSVQKVGSLGGTSVTRTFMWQTGNEVQGTAAKAVVDMGTHSTTSGDVWTWQVLDLNGDGKDDFVAQTTGGATHLASSYAVYLSTGSGFATGSGFTKVGVTLPAGETFSLSESAVIDFTGNGQKGLLAKVYRSTARGSGTSCASVLTANLTPPFYLQAVNAPGVNDGCYDYIPWTWNGSSFAAAGPALGTVPSDSGRLAVSDMDGDGLLDVVSPIDSAGTASFEWAVQLNKGNGTFGSPVTFPGLDMSCNLGATPATLTGDGRGQVMVGGPPAVITITKQYQVCTNPVEGYWGYGPCRTEETKTYQTSQKGCVNQSIALSLSPGNTPATITLATSSSTSYPESMFLADLNGDRLQDFITLPSDSLSWRVQWNMGNGLGASQPLTSIGALYNDAAYPVSATSAGPPFMVVDLNRDGRDDLLVNSSSPASNGGAPWFTGLISNGDGSFTTQSNLTMGVDPAGNPVGPAKIPGSNEATTVPMGAGDFDGDGKLDLLVPQYNTSGSYIENLLPVLNNQSADVDLLIRAWDLDVVRLGVQYGRTNPADAPFTSCNAFPQVCVRQGMPVVASLFGPDVGAAVYYRFENPRMDLHGRGFLGYDTMREWQPFRPSERTTTFNNVLSVTETLGGTQHRIYPYAGRPASVTTVTGLVNHDATWMNPSGGGANQVPPWSAPGSETSGMSARIASSTIGYTTQITPGGAGYLVTPINATTNEWEGAVTVDWTASDAVHLSYTTPSSYLTTRHGTYSYDGYANLTSSNEYTTGGIHDIVNLQYYAPSTSNWQVSQLEQKQVMSWTDASGDGMAPPANYTTTQYKYDTRGYPQVQVVEPLVPVGPGVSAAPGATTDLNVTITYAFDAYGRLQSKVAQAGDTTQAQRSLHLDYADVLGSGETVVYPSESWNEQGIGSFAWVHPAYGAAEATMDANGRTTTSVHDDLGRLVTTNTPDGDQIVTSYSNYAGDLLVSTQTASGSVGYAISDMLGRTIETGTLGLAGQYSVVDRSYDVFNRVVSVTNPGWGAASTNATVNEYDSLNRPVAITGPDLSQTTFIQSYFSTDQIDPVGRYTYLVYDNDHRTKVSEQYDATAGAWRTTSYTYAPFGHINAVTDANGNVTSLQYDLLGRRTQIVDPDSGTTSTFYNGYGEVRETDTATSSTTYTMDAAGRVTLANNSVDGKTQYFYDLATDPSGASYGPDLGKLSATITPGSVRVDYYYDALSRPSQQKYSSTAFPYQPTFSESYNDPYGRPTTVTYPAAPGRVPFQTVNKYTNGYVAEVDRNLPTGTFVAVRQITGTDPAGDLTGATFGNGDTETRSYNPVTLRLSTDQLTQAPSGTLLTSMSYGYYADGRVSQRTDVASGRSEGYTYDSLRRLGSWALTPPGGGTTTTQYGYDVLGNLTQIQQNGTITVQNTYGQYTTSRPHQLATTTLNGATTSYWYDASGRQDWSGNLQIAYREATNLPTSITESGLTTSFLYTADGERVQKSGPAGLTISAGRGLYERRVGQGTGGGDLHVFTVPGIAQVTYDDGARSESTQYLHTDDLGTLHAITSDSGAATFLYQEPFGKRTDLNGVPLTGYSGVVRGYFGSHEYDDDLGYINMKGRIYDPNLRRFLTPDPFVANPLDGQTYNRYGYVANDPVNGNDPSGFQPIQKCHPPCTGNGGDGGGTADDNYFSGPPPSPGSTDPYGATVNAAYSWAPQHILTGPADFINVSSSPGQVTGANSDQGTVAWGSGGTTSPGDILSSAATEAWLRTQGIGVWDSSAKTEDGDRVGGLFDPNTDALADNTAVTITVDDDTKKLAKLGTVLTLIAGATKFLQSPASAVVDYVELANAYGQAAEAAATAQAAEACRQAIAQVLVSPPPASPTTFAEAAWQTYYANVMAGASTLTTFILAPTFNLQHKGYAPSYFTQ